MTSLYSRSRFYSANAFPSVAPHFILSTKTVSTSGEHANVLKNEFNIYNFHKTFSIRYVKICMKIVVWNHSYCVITIYCTICVILYVSVRSHTARLKHPAISTLWCGLIGEPRHGFSHWVKPLDYFAIDSFQKSFITIKTTRLLPQNDTCRYVLVRIWGNPIATRNRLVILCDCQTKFSNINFIVTSTICQYALDIQKSGILFLLGHGAMGHTGLLLLYCNTTATIGSSADSGLIDSRIGNTDKGAEYNMCTM